MIKDTSRKRFFIEGLFLFKQKSCIKVQKKQKSTIDTLIM